MMRFLKGALAALCLLALSVPAYAQIDPVARGLAASAVANAPSTYVGLVATATYLPNNQDASDTKMMIRSSHWKRDNGPMAVVWYNGYVTYNGENASGGTATITASIEYPKGTCTPIRFGGSTTGSIASGALITSDYVNSVLVPRGAQFWVRYYWTNPAGVYYNGFETAQNLIDVGVFGSSATDQTQSCGTVTPGNQNWATPQAIIGVTSRPSGFLAGDSRTFGYADPFNDSTGDTGDFARAIGPLYAYINAGVPGDDFVHENASYTIRQTLARYASFATQGGGINDVANGYGASTILANRATVDAILHGAVKSGVIWGGTLEPRTTTTDNCATLANQTLPASEAARVSVNTNLRAGYIPAESLVIDIDHAIDPAGTGLWPVGNYYGQTTGVANSPDCLHQNGVSSLRMKSQLAIPVAGLAR